MVSILFLLEIVKKAAGLKQKFMNNRKRARLNGRIMGLGLLLALGTFGNAPAAFAAQVEISGTVNSTFLPSNQPALVFIDDQTGDFFIRIPAAITSGEGGNGGGSFYVRGVPKWI